MTNYCKFIFNSKYYTSGSTALRYKKLSSIYLTNESGKEYESKNLYAFFEDIENHFKINLSFSSSDFINTLKSYLLHKRFLNFVSQPSLFEEPEQLNFPFNFNAILFTENLKSGSYLVEYIYTEKKTISVTEIMTIFDNLFNKHNLTFLLDINLLYFFIDNLHSHIKEYQFLKTNKIVNFYKRTENFSFYHISKILSHDVAILKNNFIYNIQNYPIQIVHIIEKHEDKNRKIKTFYPAGQCFYGRKILINTDLYSYIKESSRVFEKFSIKNVFWHEIGHAVHYNKHKEYLKKSFYFSSRYNKYLNSNNQITLESFFVKEVKKNYQLSKLNGVWKDEYLRYYIKPNTKNNALDWTRPAEESFSESFAIIMDILINGLDRVYSFTLENHMSGNRLKIKSLMPTIEFLLKNIDWIKLGVPEYLYRKRLPSLKMFLAKLNHLPLKYKSGQPKKHNFRSSKYLTHINKRKLKV